MRHLILSISNAHKLPADFMFAFGKLSDATSRRGTGVTSYPLDYVGHHDGIHEWESAYPDMCGIRHASDKLPPLGCKHRVRAYMPNGPESPTGPVIVYVDLS